MRCKSGKKPTLFYWGQKKLTTNLQEFEDSVSDFF